MTDQIEQIKREIAELERQIAAHPFESLFDKKRADQLYHRLKKKRKELERAESGADADVGASLPLFEATPAGQADASVAPARVMPEEVAPPARHESEKQIEPTPKAKPKPKVPVKSAASKTKAKAKVGGAAKARAKPKTKSTGAAKKKNLKPGAVRSGAGKKRGR
ncbi:MAG: hypothetical protein AB1792_10820 [Candidatus Zixiibacteriota bacterium]